jgi:hypothetical protein
VLDATQSDGLLLTLIMKNMATSSKNVCLSVLKGKKTAKTAVSVSQKLKMEGEVKSKRSKNWTEEEKLTLTKLVVDNHHILFGELSPSLSAAQQKKMWSDIGSQITK